MPPNAVMPESVDRIRDYDHDEATDTDLVDVGVATVELRGDAIRIYGEFTRGGLLLSGDVDSRQWYAVLADPGEGAECFVLGVGSAVNEGETILFPVNDEYGLRLSKDPVLQEPSQASPGERYPDTDLWCVDGDGAVISGR